MDKLIVKNYIYFDVPSGLWAVQYGYFDAMFNYQVFELEPYISGLMAHESYLKHYRDMQVRMAIDYLRERRLLVRNHILEG